MSRGARSAYALVVDIGPNMQEMVGGKSSFYYAKQCLISYIERKVFSESKDEAALILFGSVESENKLYEPGLEFYQNITVKRELGIVNWEMAQMAESLQLSCVSGDFVEAIIVAADHLRTACKGRKTEFKDQAIIVMSNLAGGTQCQEQVDSVIRSFLDDSQNQKIEIRFIGYDCDEKPPPPSVPSQNGAGPSSKQGPSQQRPSGPSGRKVKGPERLAAEDIARKMVSATNGDSYSFTHGFRVLTIMDTREVNPQAWKTPLELTPGVTIPVQCYLKITKPKLKSWKMADISRITNNNSNSAGASSSTGVENGAENGSSSTVDISTVKRYREFRANDGGDDEQAVEPEALMRAFRYGSTLININESLADSMKLVNEKSMKLVAFCPKSKIGSHLLVGDGCHLVLADSAGGHATATRFSAFVRALAEKGYVAIVRKVYNKATAPRLGCLIPEVGDDSHHDALYFVEVPFNDALSMYVFNPLPIGEIVKKIPQDREDRDKTQEKLAAHCPDQEQLTAVDELITAVKLPVEDEENEPLKPEETRDPSIQQFYRAIRQRILHPTPNLDDPIPPASEVDDLYLPNNFDTGKAENAAERVSKLFKLTDRKNAADQEPSRSEDDNNVAPQAAPADIGALMGLRSFSSQPGATLTSPAPALSTRPRATIGNDSPLQDFLDLIRSATLPFEEICEMLTQVVYTLLGTSLDSAEFEKCRHCLQEMRRLCIERKRPGLFNDTLRNLFQRLSCIDFFASLIQADAGLITVDECQHGDGTVSNQDAQSFVEAVKSKGGNVSALPGAGIRASPSKINSENVSKASAKKPAASARDLLADL